MTDVDRFTSILSSTEITPAKCKVFGEPLAYFFYGRPAYRVNSEIENNAILGFAPICLIIDGTKLPTPTRMFPFDSGAFVGQRFTAAHHVDSQVEDFALEANFGSPPSLVKLFFDNNFNYYKIEPLQTVKIPAIELDASYYYGLIKTISRSPFDDRSSAIELQFMSTISLTSATLAVVLPDNFADEKSVVDAISKLGAVTLPYEYYPRMQSTSYTSSIYTVVRAFYKERGLL